MKILCRVRGHQASPDIVCNGDDCFSRCLRCGAELIKAGDEWRPVPSGFKVVWKEIPRPDAEDAAPPLAADEPPAPPEPPIPASPPPPPVKPRSAPPSQHVMVCDDDGLVADLLAHRLTSRGYRVTVAADGREALALMAQDPPDAVLLDAMMPIVDGYEVLRQIRADAALKDVPVIMLTARKQERDIVGALELGASDFVVKPFIPEELMSRLGRLLASS